MKLEILENKAKRLVFVLEGSTHTLYNALKDELREDENVINATYNIAHPIHSKPKFFLETKSEKPKEALEKAIKGLKKKNSDFLKAFNSMK